MLLKMSQLLSLIMLSACSLFQTQEYSHMDDLYWSQQVIDSKTAKISILEVLKRKNTNLYEQIIKDSKDPLLTGFWGKSLNFDSGAKKQIIDDQIIKDLTSLFLPNEPFNKLIVHAGVAHTYGYLFSVLDTPYGFKRKRWVLPTLNFAFSLSGQSLSPETLEGGLLSNVTFFMGTLAFKNEKDRVSLKALTNVASEIRTFNYFALTLEHLEEDLPGHVLRTTLLPLPKKLPQEENDYLLIYSVWDKKQSKEFLITAFPIKKDAYQKITAAETLGPHRPISIRYNTYLEGLMNQVLTGNRKIWLETR